MAIFGRNAARRRLRRATRESLSIPTFSSPVDCTPWVVGGLWPAELSTASAETATLAEHLNADLRRIAGTANDELRIIRRAGMGDAARQADEQAEHASLVPSGVTAGWRIPNRCGGIVKTSPIRSKSSSRIARIIAAIRRGRPLRLLAPAGGRRCPGPRRLRATRCWRPAPPPSGSDGTGGQRSGASSPPR